MQSAVSRATAVLRWLVIQDILFIKPLEWNHAFFLSEGREVNSITFPSTPFPLTQ